MNLKRNIVVVVFFIVAASLGIIIYVVPGILDAFTKTFVASYDTFQVTDDADFYIVREESVYLAKSEGELSYYFEQGEMVRKGTEILKVHTSTVPDTYKEDYKNLRADLGQGAKVQGSYLAETSGVVSYYVDGYEYFFRPENLEGITYENIPKNLREPVNLARDYTLTEEPLYKITRYDKWYLLAFVKPESIGKYQIGKTVTLYLPSGNIRGEIWEITPLGERYRVIITTNMYYPDFSVKRKVGAVVLSSDYKGIIIPNDSITTSEGKTGVYIINKRKQKVFTEIKVLASDGITSCIEVESFIDENGIKVDTVDIYDTIVRRPN